MYRYILALTFLLAIWSCDEIPPEIGMGGGGPIDPGTTVQKVLIEEFTGVRCVNCPAGSEAIEELINIHGDKLIAVSIHAGFFSVPYNESLYDFNTPPGDNILSLVGEPIGFPTAVVDRTLFDGETELQLGRTKWAGVIDQRLARTAKAKIEMSSDYNANDRNIDVSIDVTVLEDFNLNSPRVTVYILENDIKDYQLTPDGKQSDYKHKHVFRDAISSFDGDILEGGTTMGSEISLNYSYSIPVNWKEQDISIVAFIHNGGPNLEILQAEQIHILE